MPNFVTKYRISSQNAEFRHKSSGFRHKNSPGGFMGVFLRRLKTNN